MYSYIPARERRANTLYRIYLGMTTSVRNKIATAILIGGARQAAEIYGIVITKAILHYHPVIKHRDY